MSSARVGAPPIPCEEEEPPLSNGWKRYFWAISRVPVLAPEEERRLLQALDGRPQDGEAEERQAWDALVLHNLRLVAKVAARFANRSGSEIDDLNSEGMLGLIHALERYDGSRGTRLSTYAMFWIREAMGKYLDRHQNALSLDAALEESESPSLAITEQGESRQVLVALIEAGLARLPERCALVLRLRYGIDTWEHTYQEIGSELGCTHQNAQALERRAIRLLKGLVTPEQAPPKRKRRVVRGV